MKKKLSSGKNIKFKNFKDPMKCRKICSAPDLGDTDEVLGVIICSSGTTGLPKAVTISQKRITTLMIPFW